MRADAADPHGVAVGPGIGDALGTVHTARAADVFDDDLLAQNFAHALRHEAAEHVLRSAGGEGNNHRDGSRRIRLRPSEARDDRECGSARDQMQKSTAGTFHDALPERCSPRATINDPVRLRKSHHLDAPSECVNGSARGLAPRRPRVPQIRGRRRLARQGSCHGRVAAGRVRTSRGDRHPNTQRPPPAHANRNEACTRRDRMQGRRKPYGAFAVDIRCRTRLMPISPPRREAVGGSGGMRCAVCFATPACTWYRWSKTRAGSSSARSITRSSARTVARQSTGWCLLNRKQPLRSAATFISFMSLITSSPTLRRTPNQAWS